MNEAIHYREIISESTLKFAYRLSYVSNHFLLPVYAVFLKEAGICRAEYASLYCIHHRSGTYAKDIANILGLPKNSISRAINLLIDKGLLVRELDDEDNRRAQLLITEKGEDLFNQLTSNFEQRQQRLLQCLSKQEVKQLDTILSKLTVEIQSWSPLTKDDMDLPEIP